MRILNDIRLSHKSLILLAVPFSFQLIVYASLSYALQTAEQETQRVDRTKAIVAAGNELLQKFYQTGASLYAFALLRSDAVERRFTDGLSQVKSLTAKFSTQLKADDGWSENAERATVLSRQICEQLDLVKAGLDESGEDNSLSWMDSSILKRRIDPLLKDYMIYMSKVIDERNSFLERELHSRKQARGRFREFVLLAIAFNFVVSLALWQLFKVSTNNRLQTLVDNSIRAVERKPLHAQLVGKDEISVVDGSFHRMISQLEAAARKERAIIENANDVICSLDSKLQVMTVNPAVATVWKQSPQELIGNKLDKIITGPQWTNTQEHFKNFKNCTGGEFEADLEKGDGSKAITSWSVYWSDTEQLWFCVVRDITQKKELERLKQQFMAMVSHDLRSPLTSICCALALIEDTMTKELSDGALRLVRLSNRNIQRMMRLVNDLLDMEKSHAGHLELLVTETDSDALFEQAVESTQSLASESGIRIVNPAACRGVMADSDRIVRVIVNLLSNAIKFSPTDSEIELLVDSKVEDFGYVMLGVRDHGRGIPDEFKTTIFDQYRQVERRDSTEKGGTGLGLPICKSIVEQHGGKLWVESEIGMGSTFWFTLHTPPNHSDS